MFYHEINLLPAIHWNFHIEDYKIILLNYRVHKWISKFFLFVESLPRTSAKYPLEQSRKHLLLVRLN